MHMIPPFHLIDLNIQLDHRIRYQLEYIHLFYTEIVQRNNFHAIAPQYLQYIFRLVRQNYRHNLFCRYIRVHGRYIRRKYNEIYCRDIEMIYIG